MGEVNLAARIDALSAEINAKVLERNMLVQEYARAKSEEHLRKIDGYLAVVNVHGRTSCSDDNPGNAYRCNRCTLLRFKSQQYWEPEWDIEVNLFRKPDDAA